MSVKTRASITADLPSAPGSVGVLLCEHRPLIPLVTEHLVVSALVVVCVAVAATKHLLTCACQWRGSVAVMDRPGNPTLRTDSHRLIDRAIVGISRRVGIVVLIRITVFPPAIFSLVAVVMSPAVLAVISVVVFRLVSAALT